MPAAGRSARRSPASTDSGPITVISGQTVTGLRITNPSGPCIFGSNVSNVHISNNWIGPCGDTAAGSGVELDKGSTVTVDHNHFEDVASAFHVSGTGAGDSNVVFENNYATKVRGPAPNGKVIPIRQHHWGRESQSSAT